MEKTGLTLQLGFYLLEAAFSLLQIILDNNSKREELFITMCNRR